MIKLLEVSIMRAVQHALFWLSASLFWLFTMFVGSDFSTMLKIETLIIAIIFNICFAVSVYVNLYILIPCLLKKRYFVIYGLGIAFVSLVMGLFVDIIMVYPLHRFVKAEGMFSTVSYWVLFNFAFINILYIGITTFFSFVREWFRLQEISSKFQQLEKERLEAELKALKTQINPHFLFNTLNSIYSLSLYKSDKTPDTILQLSDMMRYIIYECNERYVPLERELDFIRNYIELQRIRLSDNIPVEINITNDTCNKFIAPLLFEPLIENAFKHGLKGKNTDNFIIINVKFSSEHEIILEVINSYNKEWETIEGKSKGIGVKNVRRRLELLYHHKHSIFQEQTENSYRLELKLNLL